jgi:WD40 repeat protein
MPANSIQTLPALRPITAATAPHLSEVSALAQDTAAPLRSIVFSPDSARLACSTYEHVFIWDVRHRSLAAARELPATSLAFSPDGATLAAAGRTVAFLDARTGEPTGKLKGHEGGTTCIAYSADGALLASGGMDGIVRVGHLESRRLAHTFVHSAPVRALALSQDGEMLATAAWRDARDARWLCLWSLRSGAQITTLRGGAARSLSFSPDGTLLAADGVIYDVARRQPRWDSNDRFAAFSPDGSVVATCRGDFTTIGLWDAANGNKLALLRGHREGVWSLAFSPDTRLLASAGGSIDMHAVLRGETRPLADNGVRLWGALAADPEATRPLTPTPPRTNGLRRLFE